MRSVSPAAEFYGRFTGLDSEHQLNCSVARHWLVGALAVKQMLGDFVCGVVALEAFYSDNPEVTVDYIHERIGGAYSDDTIRRKVKEMDKKGVLDCRRQGRTLYCRLRPDLAAAAIAMMKSEAPLILKPQSAGKRP